MEAGHSCDTGSQWLGGDRIISGQSLENGLRLLINAEESQLHLKCWVAGIIHLSIVLCFDLSMAFLITGRGRALQATQGCIQIYRCIYSSISLRHHRGLTPTELRTDVSVAWICLELLGECSAVISDRSGGESHCAAAEPKRLNCLKGLSGANKINVIGPSHQTKLPA